MTVELERNQLLAGLPLAEKQGLERHMELVRLHTKQGLYHVGSPLLSLYFPLDAAISVMDMEQSGRVLEVAVVGKEGCYCPNVLGGLTTSPAHTIVQIGGAALCISVSALASMLPDLQVFTRMMQRFSAVLFRHAVISVGCSQWHSVEQRLARWLLAHHHRTSDIVFPFTHEFLADQLGSQRVTVTEALSVFQRNNLVRYSYGKVELIDIQKLEHTSCECYGLAIQAIEDYLQDIRTFN